MIRPGIPFPNEKFRTVWEIITSQEHKMPAAYYWSHEKIFCSSKLHSSTWLTFIPKYFEQTPFWCSSDIVKVRSRAAGREVIESVKFLFEWISFVALINYIGKVFFNQSPFWGSSDLMELDREWPAVKWSSRWWEAFERRIICRNTLCAIS